MITLTWEIVCSLECPKTADEPPRDNNYDHSFENGSTIEASDSDERHIDGQQHERLNVNDANFVCPRWFEIVQNIPENHTNRYL